jgi:MipA family protein
MHHATARLTCLSLTLLAATTALAADAGERGGPGGPDGGGKQGASWGIGIAALTMQQAYTEIDRNNFAIPVVFYESERFNWFGLGGEYKLPSFKLSDDQELSFGLGLQIDPGGYKDEDSPFLAGMQKRSGGIWTGLTSQWSNPLANVSVQWMTDASNKSGGQRLSLGLEHSFFVGDKLMLTPSLGATWLDKKNADYYYGVRQSEARAGRPAYVVDSTVNTQFSLRADYLMDEKQALFLLLEYTALGSEIKDSPLTDSASETMVLGGYLYRF